MSRAPPTRTKSIDGSKTTLKSRSIDVLNRSLVTESFEIVRRSIPKEEEEEGKVDEKDVVMVPRSARTTTTTTIDGIESHDLYPSNNTTTASSSSSSSSSSHRSTVTQTIQYVYPSPSSFSSPSTSSSTTTPPPLPAVQESTCTLVSALSFAKENRTSLAWDTLRSLFAVQGENGFLPKYRYGADPPHNQINTNGNDGDKDTDNDIMDWNDESYYLPGTSIPSSSVFPTLPDSYLPCSTSLSDTDTKRTINNTGTTPVSSNPQHYPNVIYRRARPHSSSSSSSCLDVYNQPTHVDQLNIRGSGRIGAVPYHATFVLNLYKETEQTDDDAVQLAFYFDRIYRMHRFWMNRVMVDCFHGVAADIKSEKGGGGGGRRRRKRRGNRNKNNKGAKMSQRINRTLENPQPQPQPQRRRPLRNVTLLSSNLQKPLPLLPATCYNVLHPWESMVDELSPLWRTALDPVVQIMKRSGWTPPSSLRSNASVDPSTTQQNTNTSTNTTNTTATSDPSVDRTTQNAMLYLLQCHYNATILYKQQQQQQQQQQTLHQNKTQQQQQKQQLTEPSLQYERILLRSCPFAVLDVSHLAALSRSNTDLLEMARVLRGYQGLFIEKKVLDLRVAEITVWRDLSRGLLMDLYVEKGIGDNYDYGVGGDDGDGAEKGGAEGTIARGFFSKRLGFEVDDKVQKDSKGIKDLTEDSTSENTVVYRRKLDADEFLLEPSAFQLLAGWDTILESQAFDDGVVSPILERDGNGANHGYGHANRFTFGCGTYPIVSWGDWCISDYGTRRTNGTSNAFSDYDDEGAWIYPSLNYLTSVGLIHNEESSIGTFLQNSTLRLVCNVPNSYVGLIDEVCNSDEVTFAAAYRATKTLPLSKSHERSREEGRGAKMISSPFPSLLLDRCNAVSTLTAAVVHNLLAPGKGSFEIKPAPPIREDWVLVLIAAELAVALGIGLSCLILSLDLMKRLEENSGDGGGINESDDRFGYIGEDEGDGEEYVDAEEEQERRPFSSLLDEDLYNNLFDVSEEAQDDSSEGGGGDGGTLSNSSSSSRSNNSSSSGRTSGKSRDHIDSEGHAYIFHTDDDNKKKEEENILL